MSGRTPHYGPLVHVTLNFLRNFLCIKNGFDTFGVICGWAVAVGCEMTGPAGGKQNQAIKEMILLVPQLQRIHAPSDTS